MTPIATGSKYKAFISYSHAADGTLAPAVQAALHRVAKPWYRMRAMRVFRDKTSLAASPALWPTIEKALGGSQYFLLMASPPAAQSVWVQREIEWWLTNRTPESLLILLTDGDIRWDESAADFDWTRTTALPHTLAARFRGEPLHVDLRWAKSAATLSLKQTSFRACILDIASPLLGRDKDELDGEDVRQHRVTKIVSWLAATSLLIFALTAAWQAYVATQQRDIAEQRERAARQLLYVANMNLAHKSYEENNIPRVKELLNASLPGTSPAADDIRDFDWYYLWRLCHRELATWTGNKAEISTVAFSHNGAFMVTGGGGGFGQLSSGPSAVTLWDVSARRAIIELDGYYRVALSPDDRTLAVVSRSGPATLWDVTDNKEIATLTPFEESVQSIAFAPDGTLLATGESGIVRLWDVAGRKAVSLWNAYDGLYVVALTFSGDGRILAAAGANGIVKLYDVHGRREIAAFPRHGLGVEAIAFSPEGSRLVTGSDDRTIKIWDVGARTEIATLRGHTGTVSAVAFSPDGGTLATVSEDRTIRLWKLATGALLTTWKGHADAVDAVAFAPDGLTLVTGGRDRTIRFWELGGTGEVAVLEGLREVNAVAFSPDGRILATGERRPRTGLNLWDAATRSLLATLEGDEDGLSIASSVAFSGDGRTLAALSESSRLELWDIATRRRLPKWPDLATFPVKSVAFSPHGGLMAVADQAEDVPRVMVWDMAARKAIVTLAFPPLLHVTDVGVMAFSPEGTKLVVAAGRLAVVWNTDSWTALDKPLWVQETIASVAFSTDGRTVAFGTVRGGGVQLFNAGSRESIGTLAGYAGRVNSVAFSPDGRTLATGSADRSVKLWDVAARQELTTLTGDPDDVKSVAFRSDGRMLAVGNNLGTVRLYLAATAEEVSRRSDVRN